MTRILPFTPRILRAYPASPEALDPAELLLLGAIRFWVADLRAAEDPMPRLGQALAQAGLIEGAAAIDGLMRVIARTALRPLDLHAPGCRGFSADEQRLLHAAQLAQRDEAEMAEATLRGHLLSATGASFALGPLEAIAEALLDAGLRLRPRCLQEGDAPPIGLPMPWPAPPPAVRP